MSPIGRPHDPDSFTPPPPGSGDDVAAPVDPEPAPEEVPTTGQQQRPTIEDLVEELEAVIVQRDEFLELARLKQAEFENFRKQALKRQTEHAEQGAVSLVTELLPVLDALDNGVGHGDESLVPVRSQLLGVLEKEGLVRVDPTEERFDPTAHDAVAHDPGDGGEPVVAETLRPGYRWRGRLVRPAMVRVRG